MKRRMDCSSEVRHGARIVGLLLCGVITSSVCMLMGCGVPPPPPPPPLTTGPGSLWINYSFMEMGSGRYTVAAECKGQLVTRKPGYRDGQGPGIGAISFDEKQSEERFYSSDQRETEGWLRHLAVGEQSPGVNWGLVPGNWRVTVTPILNVGATVNATENSADAVVPEGQTGSVNVQGH
jgi:hypothetical protein